jgi:hypothetical protein
MTINQALDNLTSKKELNLEQQELKLSLLKFKNDFGGKTKIDNSIQVDNIIKYGNKEGNSVT